MSTWWYGRILRSASSVRGFGPMGKERDRRGANKRRRAARVWAPSKRAAHQNRTKPPPNLHRGEKRAVIPLATAQGPQIGAIGRPGEGTAGIGAD